MGRAVTHTGYVTVAISASLLFVVRVLVSHNQLPHRAKLSLSLTLSIIYYSSQKF